MIHLVLEFNASNYAQVATHTVSLKKRALVFQLSLKLKSCLGAFQSLSLNMPHMQVSPSSLPLSLKERQRQQLPCPSITALPACPLTLW